MNKLYRQIKEFREKAQAIDKAAIKVSVTVALLFIAVWMIYLYHVSDMTKRYRNVMDDFIMAQTERGSEAISTTFQSMNENLLYVARSARRLPSSEIDNQVQLILAGAKQAADFEEIVFIDTKNNVYFSDGTSSDAYDVENIISLCGKDLESVVISNEEGLFANNPGFLIIIPVNGRGGKLLGYVVGVAPFEVLVDYSELRSELVHDEIILNEKGQIMCQILNDNQVVTAKNDLSFFDSCQAAMTADEFNVFATEYNECINSGVPGRTVSRISGDKTLFIYYPIADTKGWSVMNCYSESAVLEKTRPAEISAIIVFAIIVLVMIFAAGQIIRYLGSERKRITELEYLDGLTGVFNRTAFVNRVEEVLKENKNLPYYMICFDVVNFRIINETYGHERSDVIIQEMAKACGEAFGHNEVYGRLTADVFVALTLDDGEEEERIKYLEQQVVLKARDVYINHPIKIKRGRYEVTDFKESINRMIDKANIARKYVAQTGSDLSCQYSEDLLVDARKADEIESLMHEALANGEFRPYLQGKFDMVKNHVSGAEALVRWIKPDGKIVPPGDFIPLFERNGFVEKVDFYMLEEVCKYIRRMIDEGREVYKVSVNQSRYLLNDPEYVSKVKAILLKYQIPVGLIELELTETVFFHEKERMIQMMNDLKNMNVDLSIDDFGSGYSSFNILKDVPFDVLKIDREFLTDSVHTEKGRIILQKIVDMAHGLGMSVICEGVENPEQIELLTSINCHYAQGFYYARPIPMEEFIEKYNPLKQE